MKVLYLIVFSCLIHTLMAQQTITWDGYFSGNILGLSATVTGQRNASAWSATVDASGYLFYLQGSIDDMRCSGTMTDAQDRTSIPFMAQLSGLQLILSIQDINPASGLEEQMEFVFTKTNSDISTLQHSGDLKAQSQPSAPNPSGEKVQLDQSLVGNWRYTESYVSGEFSFATDWHMQINADGSFLYGEGRTAGGGPNSSVDSGTGNVEKGTWKTENQVIWVNDGSGWLAYARYYRENGNLMLTFGNGKRQVWEKI